MYRDIVAHDRQNICTNYVHVQSAHYESSFKIIISATVLLIMGYNITIQDIAPSIYIYI